jgi:hypothetical protein
MPASTHRRRRTAASLLGALLVSVALSACSSHTVTVPWLGVGVPVPGASPSAKAKAPTTPSPQAGAPQLSIEQFVPLAKRFVEQHRGLKFKTDVPVTLLDDAAFRERLLGKSSSSKTPSQAITTSSKELKALHLIDKSVDLGAATDQLLGAGVSGFYDPKSKALVVRGVSATPYVRQVIVHELTHALQDQWFGIDRPELDKANDETAGAFQAVYEGDAVRIEDEYHNAMTSAEQRQARQESSAQGGGLPPNTPQVLLDLISFPYIVGPTFIRTLDRVGGQAKVDDAFVHPPTTSAQLIDINRFLHADKPLPVAVPKGDGAVFDTSVLGEFGLLLLFEKVPSIGSSQAVRVGNLWGGDQYVAWDKGGDACLRDNIVAVTAADQPALDSALAAYAKTVPNTSFTPARGGQPAQLTACG